MKKCQPGVICIENMTMFLVIMVVLFVFFYLVFYSRTRIEVHNNNSTHTTSKSENEERGGYGFNYGLGFGPAFLGNWFPDVLLNPYSPPLRDERYFIPPLTTPAVVPINVSTNIGAVDTSYRQVGILTSMNSKGSILALMGRPLFVNRDKWQYYTMSDQNNSVKLPISKAGRSCTNEYGCDKIYNGDTVYVEGYNDAYRATIYDNNVMKYLPFV
jgi:hypothetical protein